MINKGIYKDKVVRKLSFQQRILFTELILLTDDDGRLEEDLVDIKNYAFPEDDDITHTIVQEWIQVLADKKLIIYFGSNDIRYIVFEKKKWNEYQYIRADRYKPSKYPKPPDNPRQLLLSSSVGIPDDNQDVTNGMHNINEVKLNKDKISKVKEKKEQQEKDCREIIEFLNLKTGRKSNPNLNTNKNFILPRLREGRTVRDCKLVIILKCRDWKGKTFTDKGTGKETNAESFLTLPTLFKASNFEKYFTEAQYQLEQEKEQ